MFLDSQISTAPSEPAATKWTSGKPTPQPQHSRPIPATSPLPTPAPAVPALQPVYATKPAATTTPTAWARTISTAPTKQSILRETLPLLLNL